MTRNLGFGRDDIPGVHIPAHAKGEGIPTFDVGVGCPDDDGVVVGQPGKIMSEDLIGFSINFRTFALVTTSDSAAGCQNLCEALIVKTSCI